MLADRGLRNLVDLCQLHQRALWDGLWHDWRELNFEFHTEPLIRVLAAMVLANGYTRILFPSQTHEAARASRYSQNITDDNAVIVNNPDGRLPHDQTNWAL